MFDLGWTELLVIGIVALIVVGPKDLPVMFRTIGRFTGKARAMARDFTNAMNEAADESGMRDIQDTMRKATDPASFGTDAIRDAVREPSEEDTAKRAARVAEISQSADDMSEEEPPTGDKA